MHVFTTAACNGKRRMTRGSNSLIRGFLIVEWKIQSVLLVIGTRDVECRRKKLLSVGPWSVEEEFQSRIHMPLATLWNRGNLRGSTLVSGAPSYSKANECKRLKTINKYTGHPCYVMSSEGTVLSRYRWLTAANTDGRVFPTFRHRNKRAKEFCSPGTYLMSTSKRCF